MKEWKVIFKVTLIVLLMPIVAVGQSVGKVQAKLESLVIPSLVLKEVGLAQAVSEVRALSKTLDVEEKDPVWKGVRIGFEKIRPEDPVRLISLSLKEVSLGEAIDAICKASGRRFDIFDDGVVLRRALMDPGGMITRHFKLMATVSPPAPPRDDPFAPRPNPWKKNEVNRVEKILEDYGVEFPEGSTAMYLPWSTTLVVRNTVANMELVEAYVASLLDYPLKQATVLCEVYSIETKKGLDSIIQFSDDSTELVKAVRQEVAKGSAKLEAAPSVMTNSGQRAKAENGSLKEFVSHYVEKNEMDEPAMNLIYHGSTLEADPICTENDIVELIVAVTHSTREPVIRKSTVLAPVSQKEVNVDLLEVPNAQLSAVVTLRSGQPALLGSAADIVDSERTYLFFVTAAIVETHYNPVVPE